MRYIVQIPLVTDKSLTDKQLVTDKPYESKIKIRSFAWVCAKLGLV